MNDIIKKINELRKKQNDSLLAVAEKSNMNYPNIYKIFNGQQIPQINTLERILDAMGYSLAIVPKEDTMNNIIYYKKAALDSKYNAEHWFRYLRKFITPNGCTLSKNEIDSLLNSNELTLYQKITLKQAYIKGSPTNKYVIGLNQRAKTPILDMLRRKYSK